jgi:hypothetical protein
MDFWILEVELDGEWECCHFSSIQDAESALQVLLTDYGLRLSRAKLVSPEGKLMKVRAVKQPDQAGPLFA